MNPFFQRATANNQNKNFESIVAGIANGTIDPRSMVEQMLGGMNNQQKAQLKGALPMLRLFAAKNGADSMSINQMISELQMHM